jgi:hypothetical protein
MTTKIAEQAYARFSGKPSALKRLPKHHGTHAWEDESGQRIVALWGQESILIGWRIGDTTHWLNPEPAALVESLEEVLNGSIDWLESLRHHLTPTGDAKLSKHVEICRIVANQAHHFLNP